jgi:hypothetical protein
MKVKELIKLLQECNQEADVVLSSDSEGNSYALMGEYSLSTNMAYRKDHNECNYVESVYLKKLTPELLEEGYSEDDVLTIEDGGVECVVIYP